MKQTTLASLAWKSKGKVTRRESCRCRELSVPGFGYSVSDRARGRITEIPKPGTQVTQVIFRHD
jgi:hypothetical protein